MPVLPYQKTLFDALQNHKHIGSVQIIVSILQENQKLMSQPNINKDYVAINTNDSSASYPPSAKLFCNICSCNLVLLDPQNQEWYCNRCSVSYYPNKGEKVKRANRFSPPGPVDGGNLTAGCSPSDSLFEGRTICRITLKG